MDRAEDATEEILGHGSLEMTRTHISRCLAIIAPLVVAPGFYMLLVAFSQKGFPEDFWAIWIYTVPWVLIAEVIVLLVSMPILFRIHNRPKGILLFGLISGFIASLLILAGISVLVPISFSIASGLVSIGIVTGLISALIYGN